MDDDTGYGLALAFDTDHPEFARGVEIGRLWEQFKDPAAFEQTIRANNAEMVMRIAETTDRRAVAAESGDDNWLFLTVEAA